jgi:hypothetical protein
MTDQSPDRGPSDDVLDARDEASSASTLGLLAVGMCLIAPCMCYVPYFPAVVLGILAIAKGRTLRADYPSDDAISGLGGVAVATGLMSVLIASLWLSLIFLYIFLYVGVVLFAVIAASM